VAQSNVRTTIGARKTLQAITRLEPYLLRYSFQIQSRAFSRPQKQRGGNVKLVQPSKFTVQTLRLVGVLNLFEVFDDDAAAVESF
jgi:hypothetical protein